VSEWCRSVSIDTSVGRVDSVQKCPKVSKCQLTLVSKCRAGAQRAGRDAWRGWLVHQVGRSASGTLYPTGRRLDGLGLGLLAAGVLLRSLCSTCSCAPRVFRRASQGPQGRVVPFGGARQGPDRRLRTAVQQRRPGRVPRFVGAYSSSPVNRTFVSGCEGSRHRGIA
jgi:hypothetical protein